jgi:hypothetical protein
MAPKLQKRQARCLKAMRTYGAFPGGWKYGSHSETERVLESLVRHGLVQKMDGTFFLTDAGVDLANEMLDPNRKRTLSPGLGWAANTGREDS